MIPAFNSVKPSMTFTVVGYVPGSEHVSVGEVLYFTPSGSAIRNPPVFMKNP